MSHFPRLFSKNLKLNISLNSLKFYTVCFYFMSSWALLKYIETKRQMICFYLVKFCRRYLCCNFFSIIMIYILSSKRTIVSTLSLSRHEQVCWSGLRFERYFSHHRTTQVIMSHIFKGNMRNFTETIKLTDKKKLQNVTN